MDAFIMATDDHIINQFHTINDSLMSINEAVRDCSQTTGRIEGVQSSQWGAIKRVERVIGDVRTEVALLKAQGVPKGLAPTPQKRWQDILTADNLKLILMVIVSVLAVIAGISIPIG